MKISNLILFVFFCIYRITLQFSYFHFRSGILDIPGDIGMDTGNVNYDEDIDIAGILHQIEDFVPMAGSNSPFPNWWHESCICVKFLSLLRFYVLNTQWYILLVLPLFTLYK